MDCPNDKVFTRVCRFITPGDVSVLQDKKKEKMIAAEAILLQIHELALTMKLSDQDRIVHVGRADCLIARVVMDKPVPFDDQDGVRRRDRLFQSCYRWRYCFHRFEPVAYSGRECSQGAC